MVSTGMVRRIDDVGRIVIPNDLRKMLKLDVYQPMEIFIDNEKNIILKKYNPMEE